MNTPCYLGIDVGSISANLVLIGAGDNVLFEDYRRVDGRPLRAAQDALAALRDQVPTGARIAGIGATGSARHLVGAALGADVIQNEITAHARAAIHAHPDVQTVIEIGGQDSKVTVIRDRIVVDFAMNLLCAAGTGSFLDAQAKRLNISIGELSEQAVLSLRPTSIAGRCTVFAESDMIHKQQIGHPQEDILMGLCLAMARNYLGNVCVGKELKPPIVFQGGVSANKGMRRAFESLLKCNLIVPRHHMVMGALGAALLAKRAAPTPSRFRGFELCGRAIDTRSFACVDCPNECEVIEIVDQGEVIGRSGGRCRKWETRSGHVPQAAPATCSGNPA